MANRADIFEEEETAPPAKPLDLTGFATKKPVKTEAKTDAIRAVAESAGFPSREPSAKPPKKADRRHRTGRNIQLATKIDTETHKLLYQLYDAHQGKENWTLGQIIGFALRAFQKELAAKGQS